jgi:hypothetical protein
MPEKNTPQNLQQHKGDDKEDESLKCPNVILSPSNKVNITTRSKRREERRTQRTDTETEMKEALLCPTRTHIALSRNENLTPPKLSYQQDLDTAEKISGGPQMHMQPGETLKSLEKQRISHFLCRRLLSLSPPTWKKSQVAALSSPAKKNMCKNMNKPMLYLKNGWRNT